jgi:hypothetical protein
MLVMLPFVLLLLDYWPLNRVRNHRLEVGSRRLGVSSQPPSESYGEPRWSLVRHLILEKVPLLALCSLLRYYSSRPRGRDRFDLAVAVLVTAE